MKIRYASIAMLLMLFLTPLLSLDLATVTAGASAMSTASAELPFDPTAVARASRNAVHTQGDTLVVDNEYRRVEFTAEGVRFAPREEGVLVPGHQVTYRLVAVRAGEHVGAAAAPVTPQVRENQVDYDRPAGVTERYVVDDRHVEQLFVLEKALTSGGDVAVIGQFETTLAPELVDPLKGIRFLDEGRDVVRYSGAVVYDAAGRETPAPLSLDGNQVTITVPGDWLAGAVYPVTIDPRLEGGIINVGNLSMDQNNPAVAYSTASGQYLVVFESSSGNGNILGRFVNGTTGALLGSFFYVAEGTGREAAPDVAYDAYQNRFLVVYEDGNVGSRNVAGRLVYGSYQSSGSQMPATEPTMIAGDAADEYDPAVAYNANDRQFAVVYLRSTYMVYGRMLGSGSVSPLLLSAGFQIWNHVSGSAHDPDVAWGSGGNTFLAAWHRERPPDQVEPDYIAIAYLYETYQGGGSQVYGTWTIAPYDSGSDPLTTDCSSPAVAYDPAANAYVVVFRSKYLTASYTIHGQRVRSSYNVSTFRYDAAYAFAIETDVPSYSGHTLPDIAYSGFGNEMHVVYVSYWISPSSYWVYHRLLHGTSVGPRLLVRHAGADTIEDPVAAGSPDRRALVVWREEYTADDWDIFGQRVAPYQLYLPLTLRNH